MSDMEIPFLAQISLKALTLTSWFGFAMSVTRVVFDLEFAGRGILLNLLLYSIVL